MTNPFSREPGETVGVDADTSSFSDAMEDAISKFDSFKAAVDAIDLQEESH